MQINCSSCHARYPLDTRAWVCPKCGGLFEIADLPRFDPARIDSADSTLWRYRAFLPLPENASPVSMGEGFTPLVETRMGGLSFFSKLDFMNPTGSFKDRGTTVIVSALCALGISRVVEDSSGNAAASLSAYAARAGLTAEIFVPAHASPAKLAQIKVYGSKLHTIQGPRENAARAAEEAVQGRGSAKGGGSAEGGEAYYASHYYNPLTFAGMKTTAWEIWEQLGRRAPTAVVAPVGHGTNFIGLTRGFQELHRAGLIGRMPKMFAAQANVIAPLARALEQGLDNVPAVQPARTIAEGIAINRPVRGKELLAAIVESGGAAIAVEEQEIAQARNDLARTGLYVEPTSATAVAALNKLPKALFAEGDVVVTLTGSGLKSAQE